MTSFAKYTFAALLVVALTLFGLRPFLDRAAWNGLAVAASIAFPVQLVAFAVLVWARRRPARFLAAWGGGILVRFALVVVAGLLASRLKGVGETALILGLVSFLFVLALAEPLFLRLRRANG